MESKFSIRPASREDIPVIRKMAELVFRRTYSSILSPAQLEYMMEWMYSPRSLERQFSEGHAFYIAEGTEPSGYMSIEHTGSGVCEDFHLQKLYVMPSAQGRGLGRMLYRKALEHMRELCPGRRSRLCLNVNRKNPAVEFYSRMGMTKLRSVHQPIGGGFYMNDYIMCIELDNG